MEVTQFFPEVVGSIKIKLNPQQFKTVKTLSKQLEYQPMYPDAATDKKEKNPNKGEHKEKKYIAQKKRYEEQALIDQYMMLHFSRRLGPVSKL